MAALKDHNAPETKVCNACGLPRAREAYGSKQWKARSVRRCTECVTADRPVRAKAPPVPAASAPAYAIVMEDDIEVSVDVLEFFDFGASLIDATRALPAPQPPSESIIHCARAVMGRGAARATR